MASDDEATILEGGHRGGDANRDDRNGPAAAPPDAQATASEAGDDAMATSAQPPGPPSVERRHSDNSPDDAGNRDAIATSAEPPAPQLRISGRGNRPRGGSVDGHSTAANPEGNTIFDGPASGRLEPGSTIGHYRIIRRIGEGGMGTVFEAEQRRPRRRVALKVIRAGALSERVLRRFEHEAEVLGKLQHPGIAQIYEAGMFNTAMGPQPFFAMEFVEGSTLNEYVKAQNLGTRDRLNLMSRICNAVQHAHSRGVIHRDLKPGNILVTTTGQPKILDFGVARATDSDTQSVTLQTDIGQLIGTVPYMSPEQAGGDPMELDTRSDVYSLGVVCYELLAGRLPYDVHRQMVLEAVRVIREEQPQSLSTVNRVFRGDVETIVLKSLEKDKNRRYQTAQEFAQDLERYLRNDPISARPASPWYQISKFARKNRAMVSAAAAVVAALVTGFVTTSIMYVEAEEARTEALVQRDRAERESAITASVNAFLTRLLSGSDREGVVSPGLTVRELLDDASEDLRGGYASEPVVEAAVRLTIGNAYRQLGVFSAASEHLQRSYALRRAALGDEHLDTIQAMDHLGALHWASGRYNEAEQLWSQVLEARRHRVDLPDQELIGSILNLGLLRRDQGRLDDAERLLREGLSRIQSIHDDRHEYTLLAKSNLGRLLVSQGDYAEAETLLISVLEARRETASDRNPAVFGAMEDVAWLRFRQGRYADAQRMMSLASHSFADVLGEDHPDTLQASLSHARLLRDLGRYSEAVRRIEPTLETRRRVLGASHPATLEAIDTLAGLYWNIGQTERAEALWVQLREQTASNFDADHPLWLRAGMNLAMARRAKGDYQGAVTLASEVVDRGRRVFSRGENHPDVLAASNTLATIYWTLGQLDEAQPLWERVADRYQLTLGDDHASTLRVQSNLGLLYRDQGRYDEADRILQRSLSLAQRKHDDGHPTVQLIRSTLAWLCLADGRYQQGIDAISPVRDQLAAQLPPDDPRLLSTLLVHAELLARAGQADAAMTPAQQAQAALRERLGDRHADTLYAFHVRGVVHRLAGEASGAAPMLNRALLGRREVLGPDHPRTLETELELVELAAGRGDWIEARERARVLSITARQALGPQHPLTQRAADLLIRADGVIGVPDNPASPGGPGTTATPDAAPSPAPPRA